MSVTKTVLSSFVLLASLLTTGSFAADKIMLNGAGATFPYPLYSKWFSEYGNVEKDVQISYNSIGSGGGIRQLLDGTVDFGASDAPMTDEELGKAKQPVVHVPTVLGAVVLTYNLPEGSTKNLNLTSDVIAGIYLGKITKWNDPAILAINKGAKLPDLAILPVYRSDGSGTTAIFTDYMAKANAEWKEKVGAGKSVKWPVGIGGKGNEGVTGSIKGGKGALGYVELIYAESNKLPVASIKNKAGKFIVPSPKSVSEAAAGALKTIPDDFRVSITDSEGKNAYPISGFTYLLVYTGQEGTKGKSLVKFLNWAMGPGQKMAAPLAYAPLPASLVKKVEAKIKTLKVN